jgi:predicted transcriptional regulator of viral defense system
MPDVDRKTSDSERETCSHRTIGELAAAQWGVVARRQLTAAGLTESMIQRRLESGQLLRLHHGVYAVGHRRLRREGYWLGAVLAVGPRAALSHRDAAGLHDLRAANHAKVDVTTADRGRTGGQGIAVHRARLLDARDVTNVEGIPVTTVARTLVDLAGQVPHDHLARAIREADNQHKLDVRAIEDVLRRTRGRRGPGHRRIEDALAEHAALGASHTRSPLEVAFLRLIHTAGIPTPRTNAPVEGLEVDAYWPHLDLVVELDGYANHHARHAFERDRERDAVLAAHGHRVVRFTHRHVHDRPGHVIETLRRLGV